MVHIDVTVVLSWCKRRQNVVSLLMLSTLLKKLAVAVGSAPTKPAETSAPEVFSARALVGSAALPPGLVVPVATASAGSKASG